MVASSTVLDNTVYHMPLCFFDLTALCFFKPKTWIEMCICQSLIICWSFTVCPSLSCWCWHWQSGATFSVAACVIEQQHATDLHVRGFTTGLECPFEACVLQRNGHSKPGPCRNWFEHVWECVFRSDLSRKWIWAKLAMLGTACFQIRLFLSSRHQDQLWKQSRHLETQCGRSLAGLAMAESLSWHPLPSAWHPWSLGPPIVRGISFTNAAQ